MKKLFLFILLLLNLHIAIDKGSLYVELGSMKAQTWLEETLPDVVVSGSQYTTCPQCYMTVEKRNLQTHLELDCPKRTVECGFCNESYIACEGHTCTVRCALCNKPTGECTCDGCTCVGHNSSGGSSGGNGSGSNGGSASGGGNSSSNSGSTSGTQFSKEIYMKASKDVFTKLNNSYPKTAVCNFGVQEMSKKLFGKVLSELNGNANSIYNNLQNSSRWHRINYTEANKYVNLGYFVIAVWNSGDSSSGHVNTILPGHTGTTWSDIYVMDTGYSPWSNSTGQSGNSRSENQNIKGSFGKNKRNGSIGYFGIYYYK